MAKPKQGRVETSLCGGIGTHSLALITGVLRRRSFGVKERFPSGGGGGRPRVVGSAAILAPRA
jgi:hypothetical protein